MSGRNNSANVHAWVEERLSEYVDNRLAATEHAHIEQHLRECAACRASLESLRWTIALVKQAPAPALPRAFTLPVSKRAPQSSFAFGFAQFGTVLATLLLIAVIGVDVITQLSGGVTALAPSAAKEYGAPTLAVAAAPTQASAPTMAAEMSKAPAPTAAPKPTEAPKPAALQPTMAPPAALPAPMNILPTGTAPRAVGSIAPETPETKGATDSTAKSSSATAAPRQALSGAATVTPTQTIPAPPSTATSVPPTATALPSPTLVAQARAEATRAPQPTQVPVATAQPLVTPLRVVEFGLLLLAIVFSAVVVVMWRRK